MVADQQFSPTLASCQPQSWLGHVYSWPQQTDPLPQPLLQQAFFSKACVCNPELLRFAQRFQQVKPAHPALSALLAMLKNDAPTLFAEVACMVRVHTAGSAHVL